MNFAQTPQGFSYKKIYKKHKVNKKFSFDDDSALFTKNGEKVVAINGSKLNLKITDKEDLNIFKSLKKGKTYKGIGFDVHRLVKKRKLYLGGVKIPFDLGLEGHSDSDPVLHALIDSLLGACGLGDIGKLFPDKNTKASFKNILVGVGYAHAPGLLRFFAVVPELVFPIIFLTQFWIFASLIISMKQVLNLKSNFKSFGIIFLSFLIIAFLSVSFVMSKMNVLPAGNIT